MAPDNGVIINAVIPIIMNANNILENGPAANTLSCSFAGLFISSFSSGSTNAAGITGKVSFDPDTPEKTSGKVVLKTASLHVANKLMKEHIHGDGWMTVVVFPSITFNLKKLTNVKKGGDTFTANAVGTMTILKVTREITAPVTISFLKGRLAERNRVEGDLLVVRSKFQVKRGDFGINPGQKLLKVANEIDIRVGLAGAAPY